MASPPVWFITAASSGFGRQMALEALSRGHQVIASARSTSCITYLREKGAEIVTLDVTAPLPEIEKVAAEAHAKYGYITHLVNAAGYVLVGAVEETSPKEDSDCFNTNVLGMLNVCKAFVPFLRVSPGEKTISIFGSIGSWCGGPGYGIYNATKWACSEIAESMRLELAPFNISVTAIEPGFFRTAVLSTGVAVSSEKQIKAYDESVVGQIREIVKNLDNNQPGDVVKGARILIDILCRTGVAEGKKDVPIRVALGSDSPPAIRRKLKETEELLQEWAEITSKTDHE